MPQDYKPYADAWSETKDVSMDYSHPGVAGHSVQRALQKGQSPRAKNPWQTTWARRAAPDVFHRADGLCEGDGFGLSGRVRTFAEWETLSFPLC